MGACSFVDSAAGGTTLATGAKTFNHAISVNNFGQNLTSVTKDAKRSGFSTGAVTSVPFSHATPAVFGANSICRDDCHGIAHQMIFGNRLDLCQRRRQNRPRGGAKSGQWRGAKRHGARARQIAGACHGALALGANL